MSTESKNEPVIIRGRIVIAATVPALSGATVHLYLEETSVTDAPAIRLAGVQLTLYQYRAEEVEHRPTILPFSIPLSNQDRVLNPVARYTIRAWVDADSDGEIGPNDLFSDQAYPVLTHGFGTWVDIALP